MHYTHYTQHGVASATFANVITNNEMRGALLDYKGGVIKVFNSTAGTGNRVQGFDVLSVKEVMAACGISSMDELTGHGSDTSDAGGIDSDNPASLREQGFTVLFYIQVLCMMGA
jgi:hypothetical protein